MRHTLLAVALAALAAGGCGGSPATVKGRLVSNGESMTVPGATVAVTFTRVDGDAKDGSAKSFNAVVNPDGTFEVVASGGQLPVGMYRVSVLATGKLADKFKAYAEPGSPIRRELKPGSNEITIDVAKPEG